jgi:T-complex protein 1 subunit delta
LFSLRDAYNELSLHFLAKKGFLVSTDIERPTLTLSAGLLDGNLSLTPIICTGKFGTHLLGRRRLDRRRYQLNKFVKITGVGSLGKKDRRRHQLNKVVKLTGVGKNLGKNDRRRYQLNKVVKLTCGVGKNLGKTMAVLLRGSNEFVLSSARFSLQCVVRSPVKESLLIAGGGAPEADAALLV